MAQKQNSYSLSHRLERRLVIGVSLLLFLVQAALCIGAPGVEGLFLSRFGAEGLPLMYVFVGLTVPIAVLGAGAALAKMRKKTFYRLFPFTLAGVLLASRAALIPAPHWFYSVLYVVMNLTSTLSAFFAWGIAGSLCNSRQAKRLFPYFAAGGIIGSSVGGIVTPLIVPLIGAHNLILVWAFLLICAGILAVVLTRDLADRSFRTRRRESPLSSIINGYRHVSRSRLLPVFSVMTLLFVAVYFLVLYPFSRVAVARYADEQSLASFFGLFQGFATGAGFALSVLISRRLFSRIGLLGALTLYAVIFAAGFSVTAVLPSFGPLIIFRFIQVAVYLGIAAPAYQAVFNVVPSASRENARLLVDGVLSQFGMILAGALLLVLNRLPSLRPHTIAGAIISLAVIVLALASRSRYGYEVLSSLRAGGAGLFEPNRTITSSAIGPKAVQVAVNALSDPEALTRRAAASVLATVRADSATDALLKSLHDTDDDVRRLAVMSLGETGASNALIEISMLFNDESQPVRQAAIIAVGRLSLPGEQLVRLVRPFIDDDAPDVAAAALAVVARTDSDSGDERLSRYLNAKDKRSILIAAEACRLSPELIQPPRFAALLTHSDSTVVSTALELLANSGRDGVDIILERLKSAETDSLLAEQLLAVISSLNEVESSTELVTFRDTRLALLESLLGLKARVSVID